MIIPLEQVVQQISRTDQQLQYYLIIEQQETNRLLRQLIENKQETPEKIDSIEGLKRPELMKRMAMMKNKPHGWNKFSNDEIIKHLKGVS